MAKNRELVVAQALTGLTRRQLAQQIGPKGSDSSPTETGRVSPDSTPGLRTSQALARPTFDQERKSCGVNPNDPNARLLRYLQATPEQLACIDRILDGRPEAPRPVPAGPLLLGMSASAQWLGVSRATLWRMIKAGRLGKVEVFPGSFRLRRCDLESLASGNGGCSVEPLAVRPFKRGRAGGSQAGGIEL